MAGKRQNDMESCESDDKVVHAKKFKHNILENVLLSELEKPDFHQPSTSGMIKEQTLLPKDLSSSEEEYDLNKDLEHFERCEVKTCSQEGSDVCSQCDTMLRTIHYVQYFKKGKNHEKSDAVTKGITGRETYNENDTIKQTNEIFMKPVLTEYMDNIEKCPEFSIEENERDMRQCKAKRINKRKEAKFNKIHGKEYKSIRTKKIVPAKVIGPECNLDNCKKNRRECYKISEHREAIFKTYYELDSVDKQREFILRHIEISEPKQKTTKNKDASRRQNTIKYFLPVQGNRYPVCKTCFLNTLSITDKVTRTAISKLTPDGSVEKDKRGGRQSKSVIDRDKKIRNLIEQHIAKLPRVDSHYCHADTSKEYLDPALSLSMLYNLFLLELKDSDEKPSYSTYVRVFREKNLSFHHPKNIPSPQIKTKSKE